MGWALVVTTICIGICILIGNESKVRQFYNRRYHRIVISVLVVFGGYFCYELAYQERLAIKGFFNEYINVFTGIGYSAVVIGLIFTAYQIIDSKMKSRAKFSYEARKDGIEINKSITKEFWDVMSSPKAIPEKLEERIEDIIGDLLQWYAAIFRQRVFGNIEDDEWTLHLTSFRKLLRMNHVQEYWKTIVSVENGWSENFVKIGEQFLNSGRRGQ